MDENSGSQQIPNLPLDFDNTQIAFSRKSDSELRESYRLFSLMNNRILAALGLPLLSQVIKSGFPVTGLLKKTLFKQFCGGETIAQCEPVVRALWEGGVGTILDYSVEGEDTEAGYAATAQEVISTIRKTALDDRIPFCVFKVSGLGRTDLLEKVSEGAELTAAEEAEYFKVKGRVNSICKTAYELEVQVLIDAEESWIQPAIDILALEMMQLYNLDIASVYNTYQLYKVSALSTLKEHYVEAETYGFILGVKLVRGAYMEKERNRAEALNYQSPIHPSKSATDAAYNEALLYCVQHIKYIALIAGTHNEESSKYLAELLQKNGIHPNHLHVFFSQLLGMSDNLSFNLASAGYNVAKYVPYGPVKAVIPYLLRRAEENSAIAGQVGRELTLLRRELDRRNHSGK